MCSLKYWQAAFKNHTKEKTGILKAERLRDALLEVGKLLHYNHFVTISPGWLVRCSYPDAWTARVGIPRVLSSGVVGGSGVRRRTRNKCLVLIRQIYQTFIKVIKVYCKVMVGAQSKGD
jgi:hypothetical protein